MNDIDPDEWLNHVSRMDRRTEQIRSLTMLALQAMPLVAGLPRDERPLAAVKLVIEVETAASDYLKSRKAPP